MPRLTGALGYVTSGSFQRAIATESAIQWAAGTEDKVDVVDQELGAPSKDELFSWIRVWSIIQSTAEAIYFEWALIRLQDDAGTMDMNSATNMETWHKEGRLLKRGIVAQPQVGYAKPTIIKEELYNVALPEGESILLVIRPLAATAGASIFYHTVLEYRMVGG